MKSTLRWTAAVGLSCGAFVCFGGCKRGDDGPAKGPYNLLLITLDTTRADALGCYGNRTALTPVLDDLAERGVLFELALSHTPLTLPSHTTMFTGLLPPEHGLRVNGDYKLDLGLPTFAEMLKGRGYQTGAFIAAFVLDSRNGLDRGFDMYEDDMSTAYKTEAEDQLAQYRPGNVVVDSALAWLEQRSPDRPFFCWVHLYDPHSPPHTHAELEGTRLEGVSDYDAEVAFLDIQVGRLTSFIEKRGLIRKTVIIAAGDHGESFGKPLEPNRETGHGNMLYETSLHVPLIVSQPGRVPEDEQVTSIVSLVDLFATMQELLEFEQVDDRSGRSLAAAIFGDKIESQPSYAETMNPYDGYRWSPQWSLTTPEWKYIRSPRQRLFDRVEDRRELDELSAARPEKVAELEKQLAAIESEMAPHEAAELQSTAEEIERLEALGYVGGGHRRFDAEKIDYKALPDVEDMLAALDLYRMRRALKAKEKAAERLEISKQLVEKSPKTPRFWRDMADDLIALGQPDAALEAGLKCVELEPDLPGVRLKVATMYLQARDLPNAVSQLSEAMRLDPDRQETRNLLARILRDNGDPAGAVRCEEGGWKTLPAEAMLNYHMGIILSRRSRFPEAVEHFNTAVRLAPEDPLTHFSFALILERAGEFSKATEHYQEAARLGMKDPQVFLALGSILAAQGRLEDAVKHLTQFLESDPHNTMARNNLARALLDLGRPDDAAEQCKKVLENQPDEPGALRTLGDVCLKQDKLDEAIEHYQHAVKFAPNDAQTHKNLAVVLGTQKKFEESEKHFAEALRVAPGDGQLHYLRATVVEAQGKFKEAAAGYRSALRLAPGQPLVSNNLAWLLATCPDAEVRNGTDAVMMATMACEITANKDAGALDTLAAAYAEVGRFEDAIVTAGRAIELAKGAQSQQLVQDIVRRLELYKARQPYRSTQ